MARTTNHKSVCLATSNSIRAIALVSTLVFLLLPIGANADWIRPSVSPEAEIDSLERFLVIRDTKDSTFFGEVLAVPGDLNGDGISDLIIGRVAWTPFADDSAFLFYGGAPPTGLATRGFAGFSVDFAPIGDVNADEFTDFGTSRLPIGGFQLYFGGPTMDDVVDFLIPDKFTWITPVGRLQETGVLTLPTGDRNGGFGYLYRFDSLRDTLSDETIPDTSTSFGNRMAVLDFNGDGFDDLAVSAVFNRDTSLVKFYWGGPLWDTIPDLALKSTFVRFGDVLQPVGDFNADGYEDIYIGGPSNHPYGVHFGGPNPSASYDILLDANRSNASFSGATTAARLGDVNNDGYDDVLIGKSGAADRLFLYLGGPNADSIVDVYIENFDHIPGPQNLLGSHIAGIGDFNGDGINDFAAYSRTQTGCCWWAEVNFFAGWEGLATNVDIEFTPILPEKFKLHQNYPNPFNPETTIEFDLQEKSEISLTVFNSLGQEVRTLLKGTYSVGNYKVTWNGSDQNGVALASGVYFYRLRANNHEFSRKMMLLK